MAIEHPAQKYECRLKQTDAAQAGGESRQQENYPAHAFSRNAYSIAESFRFGLLGSKIGTGAPQCQRDT